MSEIKNMYILLEGLVNSASEGDSNRVLRLNKLFEKLMMRNSSTIPEELYRAYDNCRQSCVLPFTMYGAPEYKKEQEKFILDAILRFSTIPKP